jgi:hypothetical protein
MPFDPMAEDQDQCACAICHGTQCTDDDPFLLCDGGCNGGAHLKCIGLPVVPTGDWLCGQCSLVVWRDALVVYAEGKQCACKKSCSDKALMLMVKDGLAAPVALKKCKHPKIVTTQALNKRFRNIQDRLTRAASNGTPGAAYILRETLAEKATARDKQSKVGAGARNSKDFRLTSLQASQVRLAEKRRRELNAEALSEAVEDYGSQQDAYTRDGKKRKRSSGGSGSIAVRHSRISHD